MGSIFTRGRVQWIQYYRNGKQYRESARSERETDAKRLLRLSEGDIERGVPVTPQIGRLTFTDAATDLITEYEMNGRKSLRDAKTRIRLHLEPVFGERRMAGITTADIRTYTVNRLTAGASHGQINRELGLLKRMYSLAVQAGKLIARRTCSAIGTPSRSLIACSPSLNSGSRRNAASFFVGVMSGNNV